MLFPRCPRGTGYGTGIPGLVVTVVEDLGLSGTWLGVLGTWDKGSPEMSQGVPRSTSPWLTDELGIWKVVTH